MWFLHEKLATTKCSCVGSYQDHSRLEDLLGGPQDSALSCTYDDDLLEWTDTKQNQQKERCTRWSSESSPCGFTEDIFNFSSNELWHVWKVVYQRKSETQCPRELVTQASFGWDITTFQFPEEKQVFSINHAVSTNSLGTHQFWEWWDPSWNPSFQMAFKNQPYNSYI